MRNLLRPTRDRPFFLRFGSKEQMLFARRLSAYLGAGIPILEAMKLVAEDAPTPSAAYVYKTLAGQLSEGQSLSESLRSFPRQVHEFSASMIEVGEQSGTLRESLLQLALALRKQRALERKLLGSLAYPAIIVIATLGISSFLILYAFPKIVPLFRGFSSTLPLATRLLIGISDGLARYGPYLLGGMVALMALLSLLLRKPSVRHAYDKALLRLPLLGTVFQSYYLSRIARTLSTLLASGIAIVPALGLASLTSGNAAYRRSIMAAQGEVRAGGRLADALRSHAHCFPRMHAQMIGTGERTGSLPSSLLALAEHHEEEFDASSENLSALIEPVLMIVMGAIVGFIALAIITPVYQITQDMHG